MDSSLACTLLTRLWNERTAELMIARTGSPPARRLEEDVRALAYALDVLRGAP